MASKRLNKVCPTFHLNNFIKDGCKISKLANMLLKYEYITLPDIIYLGIGSPATQISYLRRRLWLYLEIDNITLYDKNTKEQHSFYYTYDKSMNKQRKKGYRNYIKDKIENYLKKI